MNKTELIAAIAADTALSKADAGRVLDSALENLTRTLARGEAVQLIGFGGGKARATAVTRRSGSRILPKVGWEMAALLLAS